MERNATPRIASVASPSVHRTSSVTLRFVGEGPDRGGEYGEHKLLVVQIHTLYSVDGIDAGRLGGGH